jgi:hypothetical protein
MTKTSLTSVIAVAKAGEDHAVPAKSASAIDTRRIVPNPFFENSSIAAACCWGFFAPPRRLHDNFAFADHDPVIGAGFSRLPPSGNIGA